MKKAGIFTLAALLSLAGCSASRDWKNHRCVLGEFRYEVQERESAIIIEKTYVKPNRYDRSWRNRYVINSDTVQKVEATRNGQARQYVGITPLGREIKSRAQREIDYVWQEFNK